VNIFFKLFGISKRKDAQKKANSRIIEYPEEAFEINMECILQNKRLVIGGAFREFSWGWRVGKPVAKEC